MQDPDSLRRSALSSLSRDSRAFVVERVEYDSALATVIEFFPDKPTAAARFIELTGEAMTVPAALMMIAEGGCYRPTFKVKVETAAQYRLLYDFDSPGRAQQSF